MTAYKFTAHKQLRQLLNNAEVVQKKDIKDYAGGHLNQSNLFRPPTQWGNQKWNKTSPEPLSTKSKSKSTIVVSTRPPTERDHKMKDVLYDFSIGTSGSLPTHPTNRQFKSPRKVSESRTSTRKCPSASSNRSLYTDMEKDGVYVEELKTDEVMLSSPRITNSKGKKLPPVEDNEYTVMEDLAKSLAEEGLLTFRHTFLPTHHMGVTKKDQYIKLMSFETDVLKKKESNEKKVLSGEKAVKHLEERLQQELDSMNFFDMGPNFHKLQIYSNTFEDLIEDSPTFVYILRAVKTEYDNYISKLLDTQTPQHSKLLKEQVEQMASRGALRHDDLQDAKDRVSHLEQKAKDKLEENEQLRRLVEEEEEWLTNIPQPDLQRKKSSVYREEGPAELADEIEHAKALILEKLDDLNNLRTKLREQYVPLTVCTHLEQCIKETEVEVQKLLKQNEYFERSIEEMEVDLKEAIQQADTSERDAKRIWRKVNSRRGLPHIPNLMNGGPHESDDDEDDESKWNWYIS
ncbi:uncharacterized protein LOC132551964 [Ylistrum balloti]|uniref:uncharacterized protein LOC132551964 n=1 Tax=Ylistrum balloti TaxID=509963 RepID=UPI002905F0EB|nr:uncharacterized protein LOC132551964 [Ylistrum balloti]